jgi:hypothetical protein
VDRDHKQRNNLFVTMIVSDKIKVHHIKLAAKNATPQGYEKIIETLTRKFITRLA